MTKYNIIDLFSGCGGLSQGFLKTGFEIIVACDNWNPAVRTYKLNHKDIQIVEGDIRNSKIKEKIYKLVEDKKINVIVGGPPCQGYSVAGDRDPEDLRGHLYLDFIEIINHIKPDFFMMENVKGLINMKHINPKLNHNQLILFKRACKELKRYKDLKRYFAQRTLNNTESKEFSQLKWKLKGIKNQIDMNLVSLIDKILNDFKKIGYMVSWKVLNSVDFGVPQIRERVIFIGTKYKNIKIKFPERSHIKNLRQKDITSFIGDTRKKNLKRWVTLEEVLKRYEDLDENVKINHIFTKHSKDFIKKIEDTPIGGSVFEKYGSSYQRLDPNKPAKTVKENHGGVFIHYKFNRVCTPRELATLQSFDDNFIFKGSKYMILKQIGNAVPPLMSEAIAESIKLLLNKIYIT